MPLPRKEIRNRAHALVKNWQHEHREQAEAKPFWEAFFQVFGVDRRRVASFEEPVKKIGGAQGFIDLLWKGKLLIEHKSRGKDLAKAYHQALDYFPGLSDSELPRFVLVSDFDQFRLYDLDNHQQYTFTLSQLPDKIHLFDFIAGYESVDVPQEETELNSRAVQLLGNLHDALKASHYSGHALEVFLVRVLFCLFAEDSGIFACHQFVHYLIHFTAEDGHDTALYLAKLFQLLDQPENQRSPHLSDELTAFPYVNGHLFAERLDIPDFDATMRERLIEAAWFNWADISPAIFGSLFQAVMESSERRAMGAHYTSEANILKLIKPLFLDELQQEINAIAALKRGQQQRLIAYMQRLAKLHFFDPACGCGNFLIITYRELRRLELAALKLQQQDNSMGHLPLEIKPRINLDHFHGIEIDEWPARIAEVAMWLMQHQMNREFAREFGNEPDLLPLKSAANIHHANALTTDWHHVISADSVNYLMGNPPFIGKNFRTAQQNRDMDSLFADSKNYKSLDYVSCWFRKAADYIGHRPIRAAFVATNSITQGEQVAPLWQPLLEAGITIGFAHRTFAWQSEAKGKAAVHVVIIGFGQETAWQDYRKQLYHYPNGKGVGNAETVSRINPYLIEADNLVVDNRSTPLCAVSPMVYGNKPVDGGHLLLSPAEKAELLAKEPAAAQWLRPLLGAEEFING
ncbi:MAG: class I SAM-dependent DNA methyltransferase, partial [Gammaproteobacteria bacterium]|nr:class I SAM-dependent DNA methyltransferase [Gammaproteobacteria bacterium]